MGWPAHPPADNPACEGVDDEGRMDGCGGLEVLGNFHQDEDPQGLGHLYLNSRRTPFGFIFNFSRISILATALNLL